MCAATAGPLLLRAVLACGGETAYRNYRDRYHAMGDTVDSTNARAHQLAKNIPRLVRAETRV